jgi:hypothetical protein
MARDIENGRARMRLSWICGCGFDLYDSMSTNHKKMKATKSKLEATDGVPSWLLQEVTKRPSRVASMSTARVKTLFGTKNACTC